LFSPWHSGTTQDYLKLDIDTKRNEFIEWRLLIILFTFVMLLLASVANIFGMNLVREIVHCPCHTAHWV
jgi:hypothetical protein